MFPESGSSSPTPEVWSCLKHRLPASSRGASVSVGLLIRISGTVPAPLTLSLHYPLECPRQAHINIVILRMKKQEFGKLRQTAPSLSPSNSDESGPDAWASQLDSTGPTLHTDVRPPLTQKLSLLPAGWRPHELGCILRPRWAAVPLALRVLRSSLHVLPKASLPWRLG